MVVVYGPKYSGEELCKLYSEVYGLAQYIQIFNVYGDMREQVITLQLLNI